MILDLRDVFSSKLKSLAIDAVLDLSDYECFGIHPITDPVKITGQVKTSADVVTLCTEAEFVYWAPCDRCATVVSKPMKMDFSHIVVSSLSNEDDEDFVVAENMELNLDELIKTDIVLNLPTKFLCKEDCKGICAGCGKSLNTDECICEKEIDPRLEKLKEFLN